MPGLPVSDGVIQAKINYVKRPLNGKPHETFVSELLEGKGRARASDVDSEEHVVSITDLRKAAEVFTLEKQGFTLAKLSVPADLDWQDNAQVKEVYYPRVEQLLKKETGATRVHIFDHTLRNGKAKDARPPRHDGEGAPAAKPIVKGQPVVRAHVDYTLRSGQERLKALLPDEWEKLQKTPYGIIQVWRPLAGPVDDSPLAMADASTVSQDDLVENILHFPERTGYVYGVAHNPAHKWYYAKGIDVDEAYVFVCYDSREGRARFTPHTGFVDPNTRDDAPPRRSVELRIYVFWENETA